MERVGLLPSETRNPDGGFQITAIDIRDVDGGIENTASGLRNALCGILFPTIGIRDEKSGILKATIELREAGSGILNATIAAFFARKSFQKAKCGILDATISAAVCHTGTTPNASLKSKAATGNLEERSAVRRVIDHPLRVARFRLSTPLHAILPVGSRFKPTKCVGVERLIRWVILPAFA